MGSSFVRLGARGFWMRDGVLELWLRLLALHVDDPASDAPLASIATTIRDGWLLQSRGWFTGHVSADLDEALATPEGKRIVTGAIESLMKALRAGPPTISAGALNLLGIDGTFGDDLASAKLLEVGQAFLDLIDGKLEGDAHSTDFMPGSR